MEITCDHTANRENMPVWDHLNKMSACASLFLFAKVHCFAQKHWMLIGYGQGSCHVSKNVDKQSKTIS